MGLPQGACLRREMLPNLARMKRRNEAGQGLTGQDNPLPPLPEELWFKIANDAVASSDDPCSQVQELCDTLGGQWRDNNGCGDHGRIYEQANQRFGWYGEYANWTELTTDKKQKLNVDTSGWPSTPKAYFKMVCLELRAQLRTGNNTTASAIRSTNLMPYMMTLVKARLKAFPGDLKDLQPKDPLYSQMAEAALRAKSSHALQYVPPARADYQKLARISVTTNAYTLKYVEPKMDPFFGELALIAMRQSTGGAALEDVPNLHPMYGQIAKIGVTTWGPALRWVPTDRPDYYDIAKAAMSASDPLFPAYLEYLPPGKSYYIELAGPAVVKNEWSIRYVPAVGNPDYVALAVLAVRAHPGALAYVHAHRKQDVRDALAAA